MIFYYVEKTSGIITVTEFNSAPLENERSDPSDDNASDASWDTSLEISSCADSERDLQQATHQKILFQRVRLLAN